MLSHPKSNVICVEGALYSILPSHILLIKVMTDTHTDWASENHVGFPESFMSKQGSKPKFHKSKANALTITPY